MATGLWKTATRLPVPLAMDSLGLRQQRLLRFQEMLDIGEHRGDHSGRDEAMSLRKAISNGSSTAGRSGLRILDDA